MPHRSHEIVTTGIWQTREKAAVHPSFRASEALIMPSVFALV
jgi:hypothetical protein